MAFRSAEHHDFQLHEKMAWDLDWNLLRTFMVIVQEQSITGAAARLNLKQPTVSNALKRLERGLDVRLIDRGPRTFEVTPAGEALYRESRAIFGTVSGLGSVLELAADEVTGTVKLIMASHVVTPLLDETLAEFHELHPAASVKITIDHSRAVAEAVFEKRAALGICLVREPMEHLDYTQLYTEHFGFFCGPRHRLFGVEGLTLEDLRGEHCVSFIADQMNEALRPVAMLRAEAELDQNISGTSTNLEEIRRMVLAGLGIGALPIHVVQADVESGLLFRLPPYDHPPAVDVWMMKNPAATLGKAESEFIRILEERVAQTPPEERTYGA
jgi:DNA-binding transcriptional LysR family regulator